MIHLDTHVVIWLWGRAESRLSTLARDRLGAPFAISPIVSLELQFLHEKDRLFGAAPQIILADVMANFEARLSTTGMDKVVVQAIDLSWTRDVFDRLIVTNAIVDGVPLLTADRVIRAHFGNAVW